MIDTLVKIRDAKPRNLTLYVTSLNAAAVTLQGASWWRTAKGWIPAGAVPPALGEIPTKDTTGAIPIVNPGGANKLYVGAAQGELLEDIAAVYGGALWLYDRLWHCGGLSGTVTTAQTVTSVPINRGDTTGEGAEILIEKYTQIGATSVTISVSYTNQSNVSGRTATFAYTNSYNGVNTVFRCILEGNDTGVRSIESVTLSASTGTAGSFGVTLARPICPIFGPVRAGNLARAADAMALALPQVPPDACLSLIQWLQKTSGSAIIPDRTVELTFLEG